MEDELDTWYTIRLSSSPRWKVGLMKSSHASPTASVKISLAVALSDRFICILMVAFRPVLADAA
ncbi:hypothetical protein D3C84_1103190 [compost metagenome]